MIAAWMIYTVAVTFLLYAAAISAEHVARALRLPARLAWVLAMAAAVVLSVRSLFPPADTPHSVPVPVAAPRSIRPDVPAPTRARRTTFPPAQLETSVARFETVERSVGGSVSRIDARALDRWNGVLIVTWAVASLLVLCWLGVSLMRLRRLAGRLVPGTVADQAVLLSDDVGPALLGVLRSRIVLPRWVLELPLPEQEIIVAHERQHAIAFDPGLVCAGLCVAALEPWNVLLWVLLARLRLAVEADCDRRVLGETGDARVYGQLLVAMYERTSGVSPHVAFVERGSNLERRIRRITSRPRLFSAAVGASSIAATVFATAAWKSPLPPHATRLMSPTVGAPAILRAFVPGTTTTPAHSAAPSPTGSVPGLSTTIHEEPQIKTRSEASRSESLAVTFRQIVIASTGLTDVRRAERLADSVADLLRHGAPFDSLARMYHDYTAGEGTDLLAPGPLDSLPLPYQKALGAAEIGDVVSFRVPGSSGSAIPKFVVARLISIQRLGVGQVSEPRSAPARPDFSGTWVLDVAKSRAGGLPPWDTLQITQTDRSMTLDEAIPIRGQRGDTAVTWSRTFMFDGSPSTWAFGDTTIHTATAQWSEYVFVTTTTWQQPFPPYPERSFTETDRYSLSDEGKTLTNATEILLDGRPLPTTLVFVKQSHGVTGRDGRAGAPTGPCAMPDSIAIRGLSRLHDADVRLTLGITPRTPISGPVVTQALKNLYATNSLESNATTTCELIGRNSVLVFSVTERHSETSIRDSSAQNIPATIREAEAQGADFPHDAPQVVRQSFFSDFPFGGTAERRCVVAASYVAYTSAPNGSLRSGDFIVRGEILRASWGGFQAGKGYKVLWLPLHGSSSHKPAIVVRAARIGNAADSVRLPIGGLTNGTSGGPEPLYGYPSEVSLPTAGQWLIVATAGNDWGCFVLDVAP
jgi:BlaR1 peptidase M56